jgi:uncharacterized hydrophobic protein (TIGR00341 family)
MRRLDIHLRAGEPFDTVIRAIKNFQPIDYMVYPVEQQDRRMISVYLHDNTGQKLMDQIQHALENEKDWRVVLSRIEATLPTIDETPEEKRSVQRSAIREEIYTDVSRGAQLNTDYLVLVTLSTIVAAIGMNANGVAAVIGAMVIAPLLGPILALTLGVALGDTRLLTNAVQTLFGGIGIALVVSVLISFVVPIDLSSRELISRAEVRLDGLALAMAAGGAAALSLARGQSSVLVGVMVAAALLPPGAAIGLFAGDGRFDLAMRAGLLLVLNIAALVLASLIVFRLKRIRPRGWIEQQHAVRSFWINVVITVVLLALSAAVIVYLDLGQTISIG